MAEKKRKMVSVNFIGKELLENRVFDTTLEEEAKKAGIFEEKRKYAPLNVILGEKELLEQVEKELEEMKEGEKRITKMLAKNAFGERDARLVRVVPLQNFLEQKINPFPGLVVRIANAMGKVQSVSSGRVRIDFNNPLAGRDIEYHIELVKEIKNKKEIAEKIYEKYYSRIPGTQKEYSEGKLTITATGDFLKNLEKVNEAIKGIAKDFDLELEFKEIKVTGKEIKETASVEEHVHGPNCNHEHEEQAAVKQEKVLEKTDTEITGKKLETKEKSINQIAKDIVKEKKGTAQFDVTRDSSTTIQRPKKKTK
ncbi:MAG: FKBP-type peptidyl-prolyl cis-trans isomerase [archaeon]